MGQGVASCPRAPLGHHSPRRGGTVGTVQGHQQAAEVAPRATMHAASVGKVCLQQLWGRGKKQLLFFIIPGPGCLAWPRVAKVLEHTAGCGTAM